MTAERTERPLAPTVFLDAALLLLGFLGLYLLLGQDTFYKADGQHLVLRLIDRDSHYPHHKLYMPLLIGFGDLIRVAGLTPYRTAVAFSAVGAAFGVGCVHVGFGALGASRGRALAATLLVGACPAVMLFATVVEFHGPFFGFAGLAFLEMAFLARRPSWVGAVFLGVLCAIAAGVHASGLVLPGLLLPWFLALRRPAGRYGRALLLTGIAAVVHLALVGFLAPPGKAGDFLERGFGHPQGIRHLPGVLWEEWLWAFLPISVTVLFGLRSGPVRLQTLAFLVGMVPYGYGALRLLVGDAECGAYLLPLAIPAAWITVAAVPRSLIGLAVVASIALGCWRVVRHDREALRYQEYAAGMRAATDAKPAFLLLGDPWELGPCLVYLPGTRTYLLDQAANLPREKLPQLLPLFDRIVSDQIGKGRDVYLTDGGERYLADASASTTGAGPVLLTHIRRTYRLTEAKSGPFRALRLAPR